MWTRIGTARGQRGQAAVETAATATVVALLLAATTAWLVATLRPPPAPPDVIGRVAAPVGGPAQAAVPPPRSLAAILGVPEGAHPSEPIGRALRAVAEGVIVAARARQAFDDGFSERAVERFREILHDPVGELVALPDPSLATPAGVGRALVATAVRRARALRAYVRRLRAMPPSEAVVTASHDAGRQAADLGFRVIEAWLRRRALGGASRPAPPPAPPREP